MSSVVFIPFHARMNLFQGTYKQIQKYVIASTKLLLRIDRALRLRFRRVVPIKILLTFVEGYLEDIFQDERALEDLKTQSLVLLR